MKNSFHSSLTYLLLSMMFYLSPGLIQAADTTAVDRLPIRKVVLYKHGVGYFVRQGVVSADRPVSLHFSKAQMNDLLKSLTVIDLSGSATGSIVYDSTKSIKQMLADYNFDLQGNVGLPQILMQFAGSKVNLVVGDKTISGVITSVAKRKIIRKNTELDAFYVTIIDDNGHMRSFNTDELVSVDFLDGRLNSDLQHYLHILSQRHRKDEKTLTIKPQGQGMHRLLVSYITEAPAWKVSYRIILPDKNTVNQPDIDNNQSDTTVDNGKIFLQGWAIVDNVSDEDWDNVELTLVSGLPVSFVQNLYDPLFIKRPIVRLASEMALSPVASEAAWSYNRPPAGSIANIARLDRKGSTSRGGYGGRRGGYAKNKMAYLADNAVSMAPMVSARAIDQQLRRLHAQTFTQAAGDLFEYKIDHRVTIERNRSAMLPIVARNITGSQVDLYNEATRRENPLAAVHLKNTTDLTLEGGPVTVMLGGDYAGEAIFKTIKPHQQRYVAYAVDLGVHVNTKVGSKTQKVNMVTIDHGIMRMRRSIIETKIYNLSNQNEQSRVIIIEHPLRPGWKLLGNNKPIETTDSYKRFRVSVPAGKTLAYSVREQRDNWQSLSVSNITPDQLSMYVSKNYISPDTRSKLEAIVKLKGHITTLKRKISSLEKERQSIYSDQQRLRNNLKSLGQSSSEKELRNRYINQLSNQENRLEDIRNSLKDLNNDLRSSQNQLDKLINNLQQKIEL